MGLYDSFQVSEMVDLEGTKIVHCKNLQELIDLILRERNYSSEPIIKLGIDGRGSFLKVSLSICEQESHTQNPTCSSLTSKRFKDSGVKRQIIVAIGENISKNYQNVKSILNLIHREGVQLVVACDMQLANIICGIQSHSSKHPCCWCNVSSDKLAEKGALRTLRSISEKYFEFMRETGGDLSLAKNYENAVHTPLLYPDEPKLVLELIPPMEPHLLLGLVNHLLKGF